MFYTRIGVELTVERGVQSTVNYVHSTVKYVRKSILSWFHVSCQDECGRWCSVADCRSPPLPPPPPPPPPASLPVQLSPPETVPVVMETPSHRKACWDVESDETRCLNGGSCFAVELHNGMRRSGCSCTPLWTGERCEMRYVDPSLSISRNATASKARRETSVVTDIRQVAHVAFIRQVAHAPAVFQPKNMQRQTNARKCNTFWSDGYDDAYRTAGINVELGILIVFSFILLSIGSILLRRHQRHRFLFRVSTGSRDRSVGDDVISSDIRAVPSDCRVVSLDDRHVFRLDAHPSTALSRSKTQELTVMQSLCDLILLENSISFPFPGLLPLPVQENAARQSSLDTSAPLVLHPGNDVIVMT